MMKIDFETVPVYLVTYSGLSDDGTVDSEAICPKVLMVIAGYDLTNSLRSAPISGLFEATQPTLCTTVPQLLETSSGTSSVLVVTQDHSALSSAWAKRVGECLAVINSRPILWIDVCGVQQNDAVPFAAHIVPHHKANASTDWLNAVLSELVQLQTDPGFIGVDIHDLVTAIGATQGSILASVGWGTGQEPALDATQSALAGLKSAGIAFSRIAGVATLLSVDSRPINQMQQVIATIHDQFTTEITAVFANHAAQAPLVGARSVVLVKLQ